MTKVLSDLQFFIFIVIPITLSLIFLPNFVNPHLIENIKLNFKIILISEKYCSINKIYCNLIIQQNEKILIYYVELNLNILILYIL